MKQRKNKLSSEKERRLVIARLEILSPKLYFASGEKARSFSRDEMIANIKAKNEIGEEFVRAELEFLRALKRGTLIRRLETE